MIFVKKVFILILVVILIFLLLFVNHSFGYSKVEMIYEMETGSQTIVLGVPKYSIECNNSINSYTYKYKNFRSRKILNKEISDYLNTLNKRTYNGVEYYYNKEKDYSIYEYEVRPAFIYNTISYKVKVGDYAENMKLNDYKKSLKYMRVFRSFNGGTIYLSDDFDTKVIGTFKDDFSKDSSGNYVFSATIKILNYKKINNEKAEVYTLEESNGSYYIKNGKLYYTRNDIKSDYDDLNIPKKSVFSIQEDGSLLLDDNYLKDYYSNDVKFVVNN